MEYFVGAALTILALILYEKLAKPRQNKLKIRRIASSQSHNFVMLRQYQVQEEKKLQPKKRQSIRFLKQGEIRVLYMDNKAYWIENNKLVVADAENNAIDKETKKEVDTMAMDKVQLDKTIFIVEKLREGMLDEGGYSGKS
jgi:uncharacterized protein Smg (DUF494 family)